MGSLKLQKGPETGTGHESEYSNPVNETEFRRRPNAESFVNEEISMLELGVDTAKGAHEEFSDGISPLLKAGEFNLEDPSIEYLHTHQRFPKSPTNKRIYKATNISIPRAGK